MSDPEERQLSSLVCRKIRDCAKIRMLLALQIIQCYGYRLAHFAVLLDVAHLIRCERRELQSSHHRCKVWPEIGRQS